MSLRAPIARALAIALAIAVSAGVSPALAKTKPMPDGAPPGPNGAPKSDDSKKDAKSGGSGESPFTDWSKVTKDATRKEGMFNAWTKRENIYWEIKKDQLGKPFLLNASYAKGIGSRDSSAACRSTTGCSSSSARATASS